MIKIRPRKTYMLSLESVAMTDIVLNMFIFFFISFSLLYTFNQTRMSKLEVRLPKASSAVSLEGSDRTILAITRSGEYVMDDRKIKASELKRELGSISRENPDFSLLLKVDTSTRFDSVVKALDVINELGIQRVSVAAVKK